MQRSLPPLTGRNTWTHPPRVTTLPLGQRNSPFIRRTLQGPINLSPVTWTFPWCQQSARLRKLDTNPCCRWRATNHGLSPQTAGTARFTALRSSLSPDICGNPPYQVGYFIFCFVFVFVFVYFFWHVAAQPPAQLCSRERRRNSECYFKIYYNCDRAKLDKNVKRQDKISYLKWGVKATHQQQQNIQF